MVSGYPTSTNIPQVDGLSTDPPVLGRHMYVYDFVFILCLFFPYPPSIYNLDYDRVKELSNRIYIQREEFRKNLDKLHALRTTIKNLIKDIQNFASHKFLCEYKNTIKETYEEFFYIKTLVKTEIIKYYIDNVSFI